MSPEYKQPHIAAEILNASSQGIWAEIRYLDSETNYREYLPVPDPAATSSDLIMTDDANTSIWNTIVAVLFVTFVTFLFVVLLIRMFDL